MVLQTFLWVQKTAETPNMLFLTLNKTMNEMCLFVQSIRIRHNTHPHGKHNKSQKLIFTQHDTEILQLIRCSLVYRKQKTVSEKMSQKELEDDFNDLEQ